MHDLYNQKNLPYLNVKSCPNCKELIDIDTKVCPHCNHSFDQFNYNEEVFDTKFILKNQIEKEKLIDEDLKKLEFINEKKPSLFLRQLFNFIALISIILEISVLLFSSYFELNELAKDGTIYSIHVTGLNILMLQKEKLKMSNGLLSYFIFGSNVTIQNMGSTILFLLYFSIFLFSIIALLQCILNFILRKKPSSKIIGILCIPTAILWIFSYIHSLIFEATQLMKQNQFRVAISSTYLFLIFFILWLVLTFTFLHDDNRIIEKNKKPEKQKKKENKEMNELFLD